MTSVPVTISKATHKLSSPVLKALQFFGVRIECKGGYGNESKELRGWKCVTAKISFMDLFAAGRDTLNNGTSSCILDALTTIANILATFFPSCHYPLSILKAT
jgi:hypothetical protein